MHARVVNERNCMGTVRGFVFKQALPNVFLCERELCEE